MAGAEIREISPEQQQAHRQIAGFFGRAETEFPAAAKQLVNVVGSLVGDQRTTQKELQAGMGNIDVGLALIGDWLKETGADGFEVNLGFGGGAKKAIARKLVKFPSVSDLIRVGGRVDTELQRQIPPLLSSFSRQIGEGLGVGLSPRQIVGGLVAESVGSRLSANGSANLREALNKPLAGHFEWIRQALKIPDAAGQAGSGQKEAAAAAEAARAIRERTGLPAFLEGNELPKGYEMVELGPQANCLIEIDSLPENEAVCYVGNLGIILAREKDKKIGFRFKGLVLPQNIYPYENRSDYIRLTDVGPEGILLGGKVMRIELNQTIERGGIHAMGFFNHILIFIPPEIQVGDTRVKLPDLGHLGMDFELDEGKIRIKNKNLTKHLKVVMPAVEMIREGKAEKEADLTLDEKVFMDTLENLNEAEKSVGPIDAKKLQQHFQDMRSFFSRLPSGGQFRVEAMKGVVDQLGTEGKKLRKAGKKDEEIYDEWLKRVFSPLYRRSNKQR